MKLSESQHYWLRWLNENGGSAYLDGHKLIANGETNKMGSEISFLHLIVKGCIEPRDGRLVLTDYGQRHLRA